MVRYQCLHCKRVFRNLEIALDHEKSCKSRFPAVKMYRGAVHECE